MNSTTDSGNSTTDSGNSTTDSGNSTTDSGEELPVTSKDPAPAGRPLWKRWWFRAVLILFVVGLLVGALLPTILSPVLRGVVEDSLVEALDAPGTLESMSASYFGGVTLGPGKFVREDGSLSIAWDSIESTVTVLNLASGGPLDIGNELLIRGARVQLRESAAADEPLRPEEPDTTDAEPNANPAFRMRLPRVRIENGEFLLERSGRLLSLRDIQIDTGNPALWTLELDRAAGSGLEEQVELSVAMDSEWKTAREKFHGRLSLAGSLGPGTSTAAAQANLRLRIQDLDLLLENRVELDDGSSQPIQLAGGELDLTVRSESTDPAAWAMSHSAELPIDPAQLLTEISGNCDLTIQSLDYGGTEVRTLSVTSVIENQALTTTIEQAQVNGGTVQGVLQAQAQDWQLQLSADNILTSREIVEMLSYVSPAFVLARSSPAQLDCRVGCEWDLAGRFAPQLLDHVSGTGELRTSPASVRVPPDLMPLLALLSKSDQENLHLDSLRQPVAIENGKVLNRGFQLATREASVLVEGHTTLDGQLSHQLRVDRVLQKALGKRAQRGDWKNLASTLEKDPVRLEGTVQEPRWILPEFLGGEDFLRGAVNAGLDLLEQEIGSEKDPKKKREREAIQDAVRTGLDAIFGGSKKDNR